MTAFWSELAGASLQPLAVGALLQLTSPLLGKHGKTLYVRPCYPDLFQRFHGRLKVVPDTNVPGSGLGNGVQLSVEDGGLLVLGNPGIGPL